MDVLKMYSNIPGKTTFSISHSIRLVLTKLEAQKAKTNLYKEKCSIRCINHTQGLHAPIIRKDYMHLLNESIKCPKSKSTINLIGLRGLRECIS